MFMSVLNSTLYALCLNTIIGLDLSHLIFKPCFNNLLCICVEEENYSDYIAGCTSLHEAKTFCNLTLAVSTSTTTTIPITTKTAAARTILTTTFSKVNNNDETISFCITSRQKTIIKNHHQ